MFDLEKFITEWRRQMLAAGLKTPVPLDELENHLREEIAQAKKSGRAEPEAFASAVQKMGCPNLLETEFGKAAGLYGILSKHRTLEVALSVNRVLGLMWLAWFINLFAARGLPIPQHWLDLKALLTAGVFAVAFAGSLLLVFNSKWGRWIIRSTALLLLLMWLVQAMVLRNAFSLNVGEEIALGLFFLTVLVLNLPEKANLKTTVKF